jgi:hypothetical protein
MTRLLHCTFVALILALSIVTLGVHVANAASKSLPMSTACQGCYDDCVKNHRGPICATHCQSRMGCPAAGASLSKSQQ